MIHEEMLETETDDVKGKNEVKTVTRKFGLSEFESLVDFRTRNDYSSNHIITLNILSIIII